MFKRKNNKIKILLLVLLAVTLGYAALSTKLQINGIASIWRVNWNVYFDNIANQSGVAGTTPTIGNDQTEGQNTVVNWSVVFNEPGEYYEFTVDVVNESSIDAMVTGITKTVTDANNQTITLPSYIKFNVTYEDGRPIIINHLLPKKSGNTPTVHTYKVRVDYDKDVVTKSDLNAQVGAVVYNMTLAITYAQATENAIEKPESLQADSWAKIKANIVKDKGSYLLGETKTIEMDLDNDETQETYTLRVANNTTPAICSTAGFSQSACGFVLEFADIPINYKWNKTDNGSVSNGDGQKGGWKYSNVRAWLNAGIYEADSTNYEGDSFIEKLPLDLQNIIIETEVVSGHGQSDSSNFTTTDRLYLFAPHEIWTAEPVGSSKSAIDVEDTGYNDTRQLDYYASLNVTSNNNQAAIKNKNNINYIWFTRTPTAAYSTAIISSYTGGYPYYNGISSMGGISPGFRLAE